MPSRDFIVYTSHLQLGSTIPASFSHKRPQRRQHCAQLPRQAVHDLHPGLVQINILLRSLRLSNMICLVARALGPVPICSYHTGQAVLLK